MNNVIQTFDDIGPEYQAKLLAEILSDHKFGETIIEILEPTFFPSEVFNTIVKLFKSYHIDNHTIPTLNDLLVHAQMQIPASKKAFREQINDTLEYIKNEKVGDDKVKNFALKFCRLRALKITLTEIMEDVDKGNVDDYEKVERKLRKSIDFKNGDDPVNMPDGIEKTLDETERAPIRTGIDGLDDTFDGGLGRQEVGLLIAPLGVGKSTLLTKIANTAYYDGSNVLQVFFEDKISDIRKKHYTAVSGIHLRDLKKNKEFVIQAMSEANETIKNKENVLLLQKYPATGVNMNKIRNLLRRKRLSGINFDLITIDYLECINGDGGHGDEEWKGEGKIMRELEALAEEFNVALWVATQGGRCVFVKEKVITEEGVIEIGDIKVGDKILTKKGFKPVTHVFEKQSKPVYKIKTKSGKEIIVSAEHKFPTTNGELKSLMTGLQIGDKLYVKK